MTDTESDPITFTLPELARLHRDRESVCSVPSWSSHYRPFINHLTGCMEFPFADGDAQEMHDLILDGVAWIETVGVTKGSEGWDVLTVRAVRRVGR